MFKIYFSASLCFLVMVFAFNADALAQEAPATQQEVIEPVNLDEQNQSKQKPKRVLQSFDSNSFPSLLFTYWEQVAIEDARRSRGLNRAPTEAELMRDLKESDDGEKVKPPPEQRNISLSGIAYKASKNWTIWLNGERVTPKAIPPEALDLKVFKDYIEIKWYDEYTNRIIPIRLRPHQRFNIDTRIFLPG